MANQAIALQARAPQMDIMGRAIQQNAQMMNMMSQQRAAQRQAAAAAQEMELARAKEAREAALHTPAMEKAGAEAMSARVKMVDDFLDLSIAGMRAARDANDAIKIGDFLKQSFNMPELQGVVDQTLSSLPTDPAQFESWRQQTLFQSMDAKEQLAQEFTTQNLGGSTRIVAAPKYAGAPGGGAARVVEGSEAPIMVKPQGMNVEGVGPGVLDPETNTFYPATAGPAGGYTPPRSGGIVGGPRGTEPAPMGAGGAPVAQALQTNPGALKDGPFARSQPGYAGSSGGFATFKTPEDGIRAQEKLLRNSYVGNGFNTIDKIVNKYAPVSKENSAAAVANYKKYIAQRTGIDINTPITASQVPVVAAAMREFETGNKPSGGKAAPAGAPPPPKTVSEAENQKAFKKIIAMFGYDPATGKDTVSPLIEASTSGGLEKFGSDVVGFVTGEATPGRVALNQLETLKDSMTFEKLRGKLGAQISNADVQLVANTMADISNPDKTANARLAAWQNVVLPILLRGAGIEPIKKGTAAGGKKKSLRDHLGGR